ncbi:MAG: hypothetical protein JXA57_03945, partial [Armatimonadetes bacterium]|nr:hypothetical protein [Armatimonadota bacterium]
MIQHHLRLHSDQHFGKRVPPEACGDVLKAVPAVARRAVAMRLSGRSAPPGRRAGWLKAATDIRFVDFYGDDDTVLVFEAPGLGEAAEELFRQPDMFTTHPSPEDSGLDLLADVWEEVRRRNVDSDLFDEALLSKMAVFRRGLDGVFQSADLWGNRISQGKPATLDQEVISAARELAASTPRSQSVR